MIRFPTEPGKKVVINVKVSMKVLEAMNEDIVNAIKKAQEKNEIPVAISIEFPPCKIYGLPVVNTYD